MSLDIPKPEYPRPDLDRSAYWVPLNGVWSLETADGSHEIRVPFAWETPASGVARTWLERATYRRTIEVPVDWSGKRPFLCFGAVHHRATVAIDGVVVAEHVGGYDSFEVDLTDHVVPGVAAQLIVLVEAPADKREIPHGKQRSIPRDDYDGVSFTPTSGIWQSVWLEARGEVWLSELQLRGDSCESITVTGRVVGGTAAEVVARVLDEGSAITMIPDENGYVSATLPVTAPRLWSPSDPHLYAIEATIGEGAPADLVVATAGLRSIEVRGEELYLNGQRLYVRGVLDQGYWPETGPTAPDDAALVKDLELARDAGYNLVRKHLKFEEPRFFHHADRMGLLVWAEPASTSRFTEESAVAFEAQIKPMVQRDGNHPSIVIWGLYNEEWGLDWDIPGSPERAAAASRAYDLLRDMDATRPIVENSGWSHVRTDLIDWHYYDESPAAWARNLAELAEGSRHAWPVKLGPDFIVDKSLYGSAEVPRTGIPIINSEYGAGFTSLERAWHVRWQTQELRRHDRFAGYVYTELTDIEHEAAGLFDAHRQRKDWGGLDLAAANAETVLVVDIVPLHAGADISMPTNAFTVTVHLSHHGTAPLAGALRGVWVAAGAPFSAAEGEHHVQVAVGEVVPFRLSEGFAIAAAPPPGSESARLFLWLVDSTGSVRAHTFIDAAPVEEPNRRGARA